MIQRPGTMALEAMDEEEARRGGPRPGGLFPVERSCEPRLAGRTVARR